VSDEDSQVMRLIDEIYTRCPFYGSRRITAQLIRDHGELWNRKRIQRLMRLMGIRGSVFQKIQSETVDLKLAGIKDLSI